LVNPFLVVNLERKVHSKNINPLNKPFDAAN